MRSIFHVDVNSAYLSWTAVAMLEKGAQIDLREVPAVIAGDPKNRHGIILAKSIPAKKYGIKTGESLWEASRKCSHLMVMPPDYDLYMACSEAMKDILSEYSSRLERYSIDECFLDYTASQVCRGDPLKVAHEIRRRMKKELGFTVNIGVSVNKLLAKMASELRKPDQIHTLWPEEMAKKMWPLPVGELFMVGNATKSKLEKINIRTIGDLARADPVHLQALLKSHGKLVWEYANGIDATDVIPNDEIIQKGVGNSTTTAYDVTDRREALVVLLALTERTCQRLRRMQARCSVISVSLKTDSFWHYSHQVQLPFDTDSTNEIYQYVTKLFGEMWRSEPLRHLGVHVSRLSRNGAVQLSIFSAKDPVREEKCDQAVDQIRRRFGNDKIMRGCFVNGPIKPMQGGTNDGDYINLGGYRS